ncbi:hypothetical protein KAR34_07920 [bacterium]|nr:hypothetical protein [bacterium]
MPNHIQGIIEICRRDAIYRVSDNKQGGITQNANPKVAPIIGEPYKMV